MSVPVIRTASPQDAARFHAVMREAYDSLDNKDVYICDEYGYVKSVLEDDNAGFGLVYCETEDESCECARDVIEGVLLVTFPGEAADNLAGDIPDMTQHAANTAHIESAAVGVRYRGKGIQRQLIEYACDYLGNNCGNIKYVMATVSPDNIASLRSFEKAGFRIMLTKRKYGGKLRHILMREI